MNSINFLKKNLFLLSFLLTFIFLSGCSSLPSGHYVQIEDGENIDSLSNTFDVPIWELEKLNPGKSFTPGKWVFIPQKQGILAHTFSGNSINSSTYLKSGEFLWPVPGGKKISSPFGRRWGRPHEGIDIVANIGAHILATNDGIVVYEGNEIGGYGNILVLSHRHGFFSVYAHNDQNLVRQGQKVHRGQVIGKVGNSGRSTGPHLHFEIRRDSRALDPLKLVSNN